MSIQTGSAPLQSHVKGLLNEKEATVEAIMNKLCISHPNVLVIQFIYVHMSMFLQAHTKDEGGCQYL